MKSFYLLTLLLVSTVFASAQVVDQFNYSGTLISNGWANQSGTSGELSSLSTASDAGNSLSYSGLVSSVGNRAVISSSGSEDVNKAVTGISGTGYYSMLIKVLNTTGLNSGAYFAGFAATSGFGASAFGGKLYIKNASAGHFQLGVQASNGTVVYHTTDLAINTTFLVVVKLSSTGPGASLFINPVTGSAEPTATVSQSGGAAFNTMASIFLRQTSGTGNIEIDEIRAGSTWASVTPSGCATSSNILASACGSYDFHGTILEASGDYTHVLTNGNSQGCDSTINLTLTINQPTTHTITTSACETYTLNGTIYDETGTYTQVLEDGNANGCDSTITLNLSIVSSVTYYEDADGDGFGDAASTTTGCTQPDGFVTNDDDCDDDNDAVGVATVTYYTDADGDGFGNPATGAVACTQPAGSVMNGNDCDDDNDAVGAAVTWYPDTDGDGYGDGLGLPVVNCTQPLNHVANSTDCDDDNNAVHPGATEIPDNGIDEDCSGADLSTALGMYEFTATGACPVMAVNVTTQPANATFGPYSTAGTECASANNVFNNDGWNLTATIDLAEYNQFYIVPADCYSMDLTHMNFDHKISGSGETPFIHVRSSVDDFTTDIHMVQLMNDQLTNVSFDLPASFEDQTDTVYFRIYITEMGAEGATYRNDNVKINGSLSALPTQTYYADTDSDGFGDAAVSVTDCEMPEGYVSDNTDCNDDNADEFPGAVWFQDLDSDGFGNPTVTLTQCLQPADYVSDNTDCNDNDEDISGESPFYADADGDGFGASGSTPVMDCSQPTGYAANDDDCDDEDDEVTIATIMWYPDADGDLYGQPGSTGILACSQPAGYAGNDDDCDDANENAYPGAPEVCDGVDNDCDGQTDEGITLPVWYADEDGDTFGNPDEMMSDCDQPAGYVADNTDCDDDNAAINPDATEVTGNGVDENCDNLDGNVGIEENILSAAVVFPNPGSKNVTVTLSSFMQEEVSVTFISADGKVITAQKMVNGISTIDTQNVEAGIYMIRISTDSATAMVRWVKS